MSFTFPAIDFSLIDVCLAHVCCWCTMSSYIIITLYLGNVIDLLCCTYVWTDKSRRQFLPDTGICTLLHRSRLSRCIDKSHCFCTDLGSNSVCLWTNINTIMKVILHSHLLIAGTKESLLAPTALLTYLSFYNCNQLQCMLWLVVYENIQESLTKIE